MKCIITGHTTGVAKVIYNYLKEAGWEVIGVSRVTGYDLATDIDSIVHLSQGADLFINCANVGRAQLELLEKLHDKVDRMIVFGSVAGDFHQQLQSDYSEHKRDLANRCFDLSLKPDVKILHLNISMMEDAVTGDVLISYKEVMDTINFWLDNPRIRSIAYEFKLTPFTLQNAKDKFNISQEALDRIISNMCGNTKAMVDE
jgi:NAD(P)-dependent dehydrogenase (short-subunit alcohol dehydrogenase family)